MDVRAVLPTVRVPTLVVHHADDPLITPAMGRYVADHITGAKYVELQGRNLYHFVEPWRLSFQGRAVSTSGDSFLAMFDGPRRAIRGAMAGPNELLVSNTLRDLVIGSGLEFEDRGDHTLKGVPGEWRLSAVAS
jgi:hypothetical protein